MRAEEGKGGKDGRKEERKEMECEQVAMTLPCILGAYVKILWGQGI